MDVKRKCIHERASMIKSAKTVMTYPRTEEYICPVCHKVFKYTFDAQGAPLLVKD